MSAMQNKCAMPTLSKTLRWVFAGIILTIICVWTIDPALTLWLSQHPAPHSILIFAQTICLPFNPGLWTLISLIMVILITLWAYQNKITTEKKQHIAAFFTTFLCLSIATSVLKIIIGRARPFMFVQDHISGFFPFMHQYDYYSMPSGHITTTVFLCCGLFLWTRLPLLRVLGLIITALVMMARIVLLKHFVGDACLSITLSLLFFMYRNAITYPWLTLIKRIHQHIHQPGLR